MSAKADTSLIAPTASGTIWPIDTIAAALACAVALAVPFCAFTNLILYHFYTRGAFLMDTGFLAALAWRPDMALTPPPIIGTTSYFATHVSPLFLLTGLISRLLPVSMPMFFSCLIGFSHAALAGAVYWLLIARPGGRRAISLLLAVCGGIGFAFSGLALAIVRYPHFETLIAAFFLLGVAARARGCVRLAAVCFVLGMATREDAGLHYAAFFIPLAGLNAWRGRPFRADLLWGLAALTASVMALLAQRLFFGSGSAFARVYLGDPPLSHLTLSLLWDRVRYLLLNRPYIVWPGVVCAFWAVRVRNPAIFLGYAVCLPWLALHLIAVSPMAGAVVSYYAFPFLMALGWPLVVSLSDRVSRPRAPLWFGALLAASFVPVGNPHDPGRMSLMEGFLNPPSYVQRESVAGAIAAVAAARPGIGRVLVDDSILSLAPYAFSPEEIPYWPEATADRAAETGLILFMAGGREADMVRALATAARLRFYEVPGTAVRLATRRAIEDLPVMVVPEAATR